MIVSCPSCATRYRYPVHAEQHSHAQCSRCECRFPLGPSRRVYRLRAAATVAVAEGPGSVSGGLPPSLLPASMSSPSAADPAAGTGHAAPPAAYEVDAEAAIGMQQDALDAPDFGDLPEFDDEIEVPFEADEAEDEILSTDYADADAEAPVPAADKAVAERPAARQSNTVLLSCILLAVGGAAVSYHLALNQGIDPLTWTAAGALPGLLLGWARMLWKPRRA